MQQTWVCQATESMSEEMLATDLEKRDTKRRPRQHIVRFSAASESLRSGDLGLKERCYSVSQCINQELVLTLLSPNMSTATGL